MAVITLKQGFESGIANLTLAQGELAVAWNADKTAANLYVGNGKGDNLLLLAGISGSALLQALNLI